jgi:hypothetical protein
MACPSIHLTWLGRNMVNDPEKYRSQTGKHKKPDPWKDKKPEEIKERKKEEK